MSEAAQRAAVVTAARSWVGTPYHHAGRVKGAGVDCLTLLAEVFHEAGVVAERVEVPHYPPDWHLHRDAERYMEGLARYTRELDPTAVPLPGDVALWRFGRCFSHGAIVVAWPAVVHARMGSRVSVEDAERSAWLATVGESARDRGRPRPRKFFSHWGPGA